MKVFLVVMICAVWLAVGVAVGQCTAPEQTKPAPVPSGVASSVAAMGDTCVKTIDECLASNRECIAMLKETVEKADDYLTILEKVTGKKLHNLPPCDAGRD
jgi:hypothetical protein